MDGEEGFPQSRMKIKTDRKGREGVKKAQRCNLCQKSNNDSKV